MGRGDGDKKNIIFKRNKIFNSKLHLKLHDSFQGME